MTDFDKLPDEDLCVLANSGDENAGECLLARHRNLVRSCVRPYFLTGGDSEDLLQEGMLGLLSAIRHFDAARGVKFSTYAHLCIHNRILSAVREAAGTRNQPLNDSLSIESETFSHPPDLFAPDPEQLLMEKEDVAEIWRALDCALSPLERKVLALYLEGMSYREIADRLGKVEKSVDNAVQRIRKKLAQQLNHGEFSES